MLTKLVVALVLSAGLVNAQTAPVFYRVAMEGNGQAASPVVTLTVGMTYRFGSGTNWCDAVTVTATTSLTIWFAAIPCTVNGVVTADPDPNVQKEIDVAEQASVLTIPVMAGTVASSVTVPALPPPPTPPATTTYATTCSTTVDSSTGLINIILSAAPSN